MQGGGGGTLNSAGFATFPLDYNSKKLHSGTLNKTFLEEEERNSGKILPKIKIFLLIKRITFETIVVRKYG